MNKRIEDYERMAAEERVEALTRWMWEELHDFKKEMCKVVGFNYDGNEVVGFDYDGNEVVDTDDPHEDARPDSILIYGTVEQLPPLLGCYEDDEPQARLLKYRLEHPDIDPTRYVRSPEFGEVVKTYRADIVLGPEELDCERMMLACIWHMHDIAFRLGLKELCEHIEAWAPPM